MALACLQTKHQSTFNKLDKLDWSFHYSGTQIHVHCAPEFATYDLSTAFGPVTSEDAFVYGVPLPTSAGDLILDPFTIGTATFTATIPEPSTWAMMLLGFAGLGIAGYRRSLKPVSGAV